MHEATPDFDSMVTAELRRVVGEADPSAGINRQFAFEIAHNRIRSLIDNGELQIDLDAMTDRYIRTKLKEADESDGRAADKIIAKLIRGQETFDIEGEDFLDVMVTLGDGLRKPWKNVGTEDIFTMYEIRADNMRKQEEAFKKFTEDMRSLSRALNGFNSIGEAWRAGKFAHIEAA